jgi:hypothetical protein
MDVTGERDIPILLKGEKMDISRRGFLKGAAILGAGSAIAAGVSACGTSPGDDAVVKNDVKDWDDEADFVIVGYGGAGSAAAITAIKEGLGTAILLEAAPEEEKGGNTRTSGNAVFCPDNAAGALTYQTALNGPYDVPEDCMRAWADEIVKNVEWLNGLGADMQAGTRFSPEFPEVAGSDTARAYWNEGKNGAQSLWTFLQPIVDEDLGINIYYKTRAQALVRDDATNMALGVVADQDGKTVYYKANKGIILTCGGFQNNQTMLKNYFGMYGSEDIHFQGTPYNRGDGFAMIAPFGAELWHMNNVAGPSLGGIKLDPNSNLVSSMTLPSTKDWIYVGPNAKRFVYEEATSLSRHGKMNYDGCWLPVRIPSPNWLVFGADAFADRPMVQPSFGGWHSTMDDFGNYIDDMSSNKGLLDKGYIITADTPEGLASQMNLDATTLAETINTYNGYAANNLDRDYGRGQEVYDQYFMGESSNIKSDVGSFGEAVVAIPAFNLAAINPPYYALRLYPNILNTQGGPKRSPKGEVLDYDGNPIPHLYAAGEFGPVYSYMYNGGGNVGDALSSGRIAARNAATNDSWDSSAA